MKTLVQVFKPTCGYQDLMRYIKEGIKYTKLVSQRNFLEKLLARGESTPEIQTLAKRMYTADFRQRTRYKHEERRIMLLRIKEKNYRMKQKKREWTEIEKYK